MQRNKRLSTCLALNTIVIGYKAKGGKMMEDRKLNEKESLELIARMIQNSKRNMQLGNGNLFLLWGYISIVTAVVVLVLVEVTGNPRWNWMWFAVPIIGMPFNLYLHKKHPRRVLTYTDRVLGSVWGSIATFAMLGCVLVGTKSEYAIFILPILMMCISLGVYITGEIIEYKWMINVAMVSFGAVMATVVSDSFSGDAWLRYHVLCIVCIVLLLIIPGHRMNREAKRQGVTE